jgi:hypothetical protein
MEWTGALGAAGYGRLTFRKKWYSAHRLAYSLAHNITLKPRQFICHRCDNPKCINVDHLFLGDAISNVQDMNAKGRANCGIGERNGFAKLTEIEVLEIREALDNNELPRLVAERYGVGRQTVVDIGNRTTWKHIP